MKLRLSLQIVTLLLLCQLSKAQDWAGLDRFRAADDSLAALPNQGNRVVFMGNSITDFWINNDSAYFANNNYVDRGYSGQTSPQMLLRFRPDVIDLKPAAVVLLCGINDIAGNTGPSTLKMIEDNIQSMAELGQASKIKVILCSVLPAYDFPWKPNSFPSEKIIALNAWISRYALDNHCAYIDYYSKMVEDRNDSSMVNNQKGMKKEFTEDGVHPNKAGYVVMENIAQPVIRRIVKAKKASERNSLF